MHCTLHHRLAQHAVLFFSSKWHHNGTWQTLESMVSDVWIQFSASMIEQKNWFHNTDVNQVQDSIKCNASAAYDWKISTEFLRHARGYRICSPAIENLLVSKSDHVRNHRKYVRRCTGSIYISRSPMCSVFWGHLVRVLKDTTTSPVNAKTSSQMHSASVIIMCQRGQFSPRLQGVQLEASSRWNIL